MCVHFLLTTAFVVTNTTGHKSEVNTVGRFVKEAHISMLKTKNKTISGTELS